MPEIRIGNVYALLQETFHPQGVGGDQEGNEYRSTSHIGAIAENFNIPTWAKNWSPAYSTGELHNRLNEAKENLKMGMKIGRPEYEIRSLDKAVIIAEKALNDRVELLLFLMAVHDAADKGNK